MSTPPLTAGYFDGWYADMVASPVKDDVVRRHLGLPPYLQSTSVLPWDGIAEVVTALRMAEGGTLLDLACGRGGYGLEIARRTSSRLVGVDFSGEAVRQATASAAALDVVAHFAVGDLAATGLDDGSVDAVLCVDAIQFAEDPAAAYAELGRVLRPGGRVVLTCWEPVGPPDDRVPERIRRVDLRGGLVGARFDEVEVVEQPGWWAAEQAMWAEAAGLDPGDDAALRSFHEEGVRALSMSGLLRRLMASGTSPTR